MAIVIIVLLIIMAIYDAKYLEVPLVLIVLGLIAGMVFSILHLDNDNLLLLFYAIMPSILYVILHFIIPDSIGLGDGLVLLISEMTGTIYANICILCITSIVAGIYAMTRLIIGKKKAKIPYVLFIALGHISYYIGVSMYG